MWDCWHPTHSSRPTVAELASRRDVVRPAVMSRQRTGVRARSPRVIAGWRSARQNHGVRFLVVSIAVHALVVWWLAAGRQERVGSQPSIRSTSSATEQAASIEPIAIEVDMIGGGSVPSGGSPAAPSGGSPAASSARATTTVRRARTHDAWNELTIRDERDGNAGGTATTNGNGTGHGIANGIGNGNGIGFGTGGGIGAPRGGRLPPVPVPVVSKARPARLIWPTRDREVEDDADLFIARVIIDENGDVVGARMVKTRPGARGDHAANAIWQFRYLPALDDRGVPTRSTLEQPFQIR